MTTTSFIDTFLSSLQVFTTFPVKTKETSFTIKGTGKMMPLVGVLIGLFVATIAVILAFLSTLTVVRMEVYFAAVVLIIWVLSTGIIHLDGLADTIDAYFSCKDKAKMMDIMKDPHIGTGGVFAIVLNLIVKFACIVAFFQLFTEMKTFSVFYIFLIAPVISRFACYLAMVSYPYIREDGFAKGMVDEKETINKSAWAMMPVIVLFGLGLILFFNTFFHFNFIITFLFGILLTMSVPKRLAKILDGHTGDTYGATIELTETLFLVVAAIWMAST